MVLSVHKSTAFLTGVLLLAATSVMAGGGDGGADGGDSGGAGVFIDNTPLTLKKGITTQAQESSTINRATTNRA
jgi:hypothetical protein